MLAQGIPERLHRCGTNQRSDIGNANALHQIKRGGAFGSNEGTAQRAENISASRTKGTIPARFRRAGEIADGISGTRDIRK